MSVPILKVQQVSKQFRMGKQTLHAVKNVSFSMLPGEILGLGGESGCGKSTIGKLLMGLLEPTNGSIFFEGQGIVQLAAGRSQAWRRSIQMIFQHPATSLDPRFTVEEALLEPFAIHRLSMHASERSKRLKELLEQVGLPEEILERLPDELSGGQKQRIAIARALALDPRFLICDEPFSSLDVSVQSQIINLLVRLHKEKNLSYLIISHDLSILRYLTHQLAIMYLGEIVEKGPSEEVYDAPLHPYSQALGSAVLIPDPVKEKERVRIAMKGDVPSLLHAQPGCPFASRCPHAQSLCLKEKPTLREVRPGRFASCHLI